MIVLLKNFHAFFAHNVQICAKFSCKNITDVWSVFWMLRHDTYGAVFSWTQCTKKLIRHVIAIYYQQFELFFQTNKATSTFSCTHSWQYFPTLIFMLLVILSIQANQILSAVQTGNIIMLMTYNNNNNNSSTQYKQNSHFQTFNMCGKVKRAYWLFIRWLLSN